MGLVYNVTKGRTEYLIGLDEGGSGGGTSKKRIIIKSDTIPEASSKTYKLIYIYSGESNGTYHHGYIYECIADVTYDAKNIYFDSHNMGFDYRNADPSKNFTTDGEAMEAFLELVLRNKDVSFLQVTNGALSRKETGMWNVQLKDKDGNILLDNYQLGPEDLEDFGFIFLQQQSAYVVGEPEDFDFVWEQTLISNYRWEQLDVQPNGSGGDLSIYQLKMNMTQDPNSTSQGTYPSSKALSQAIDSVKNTLTLFDGNTGTVIDTHANLGTVIIFKNGQQIYAGADRDYTINGSIITFAEPLVESDIIAVVNNNLVGLQLSEVATSGDYNDLINKPVMSFSQAELIKVTANDTFVDLAQEIQSKNLPTGTILYGEVYNTPKPSGINNAEVRVEILDTKTSGQYTGKQVLEFTLYSADVSPYQWTFVYYQPNYEQNQQTWEWHGIGGGGSSNLSFTNVSASNWINDNTYSSLGYVYKCELSCEGITADDYATVLFSSTDVNSGNYANICETGSNIVTIYSKTNTSIIIPKIVVIR